jgi:hypothetical protein
MIKPHADSRVGPSGWLVANSSIVMAVLMVAMLLAIAALR